MPELATLCRAVEKVFSCQFQTNIYLSPPNAQGFGTHFDSHDVFVLQVAGSKIWTLNDTLIELPLHAQGFEKDKHIPGPATRELTIRAGDVFYCPRGLFHSARSTDEHSLHITLGLMGKTWADVMMEAVSAACLSSPAFRANLPAGFANSGFDVAQAKATFRSLVDEFARSAELEPILRHFAEEFVTSRRPDLSGALQDIERRDGGRHPTPRSCPAHISCSVCARRATALRCCSHRPALPSRQPFGSRWNVALRGTVLSSAICRDASMRLARSCWCGA